MDAEFLDRDRAWFEQLYDRVIAGNRRMNLTRITEPEAFIEKHVLDSALPFLVVPALADLGEEIRAADLGSGAGFPGLVLARLHPRWEVALIERTRKKAVFLEETRKALGLDNVTVLACDAGEVHLDPRDLVVARAVGLLAAVTKAAAPLLAARGLLVHYKGGALGEEEIEAGRRAARSGHIEQEPPVAYTLPSGARRSVVLSRSIGRRRNAKRPRNRAKPKSPGDRVP